MNAYCGWLSASNALFHFHYNPVKNTIIKILQVNKLKHKGINQFTHSQADKKFRLVETPNLPSSKVQWAPRSFPALI